MTSRRNVRLVGERKFTKNKTSEPMETALDLARQVMRKAAEPAQIKLSRAEQKKPIKEALKLVKEALYSANKPNRKRKLSPTKYEHHDKLSDQATTKGSKETKRDCELQRPTPIHQEGNRTQCQNNYDRSTFWLVQGRENKSELHNMRESPKEGMQHVNSPGRSTVQNKPNDNVHTNKAGFCIACLQYSYPECGHHLPIRTLISYGIINKRVYQNFQRKVVGQPFFLGEGSVRDHSSQQDLRL